jgi:hypothetical protein
MGIVLQMVDYALNFLGRVLASGFMLNVSKIILEERVE